MVGRAGRLCFPLRSGGVSRRGGAGERWLDRPAFPYPGIVILVAQTVVLPVRSGGSYTSDSGS
eukprot:6488437-Amphidinium_carterae.1